MGPGANFVAGTTWGVVYGSMFEAGGPKARTLWPGPPVAWFSAQSSRGRRSWGPVWL